MAMPVPDFHLVIFGDRVLRNSRSVLAREVKTVVGFPLALCVLNILLALGGQLPLNMWHSGLVGHFLTLAIFLVPDPQDFWIPWGGQQRPPNADQTLVPNIVDFLVFWSFGFLSFCAWAVGGTVLAIDVCLGQTTSVAFFRFLYRLIKSIMDN